MARSTTEVVIMNRINAPRFAEMIPLKAGLIIPAVRGIAMKARAARGAAVRINGYLRPIGVRMRSLQIPIKGRMKIAARLSIPIIAPVVVAFRPKPRTSRELSKLGWPVCRKIGTKALYNCQITMIPRKPNPIKKVFFQSSFISTSRAKEQGLFSGKEGKDTVFGFTLHISSISRFGLA
jgi:hypothetical protein